MHRSHAQISHHGALRLHTARRILAAGHAILAVGCASGSGLGTAAPIAMPPSEPPADVTSPAMPAAARTVRWTVEPVTPPGSFQGAVNEGTRTLEGTPGPSYWTQKVDYRIEAELDPETAMLVGSETITYQNNSPNDIGVLILRLYQNLFRPGAQRTRDVPITRGITLQRVALDGQTLAEVTQPEQSSYLVDGTLMIVYLDRLLPSGAAVELDIEWSFEVPPEGAPRQGHIENGLFNVAQWYPQVAVYDDLEGWHIWPYLGNGEFYLEYGDFDVTITVPEGWLVGATGTLQNPDQVLPSPVLERLEQARTTDEVVRIVTEDDFGPGQATVSSSGGTLSWHFTADGVRDFAFATSDQYVWDAASFETPDSNGDGQDERVMAHALYRPVAESWADAADYIRHSVAFHAERWHPYPWPQMTGAEGPVGGMEYPMLTFVEDFSDPRTVYEVLNHEIGHMWYPMMVGSNESSYPWMDEGLTTYIEGYATADFFDERDYWFNDQNAYLAVAGSEYETPIMRHSDLHGPYGTYPQAAYWKPAALLRALEMVIGREAVWQSLRSYAENWLYRHPSPHDFFNLVESTAGRDLDWFWHPFWYETAVLDQAVVDVRTSTSAGGTTTAEVQLHDLGGAPMPVFLQVNLEGGEAVRETVPVEVWLSGARDHTVSVELPAGARIVDVEIDPGMGLPDVDRENNIWEP